MNFDLFDNDFDDDAIISSNDMFDMDSKGDLYNRIDDYTSLNLRTGKIRVNHLNVFEDDSDND